MGYCSSCKTRTSSFCFVHKRHVCDNCIIVPRDGGVACEANCVVRTYFDWLDDADYTWPPRCTLCNRTVTSDPVSSLRLSCKCVLHSSCLRHMIQRAHSADQSLDGLKITCPNCGASTQTDSTSNKLLEKVYHFVEVIKSAPTGQTDIPPSSSSDPSPPLSLPHHVSSVPQEHKQPFLSTHDTALSPTSPPVPSTSHSEDASVLYPSSTSNASSSAFVSRARKADAPTHGDLLGMEGGDVEAQQEHYDRSTRKKRSTPWKVALRRWLRMDRLLIVALVLIVLMSLGFWLRDPSINNEVGKSEANSHQDSKLAGWRKRVSNLRRSHNQDHSNVDSEDERPHRRSRSAKDGDNGNRYTKSGMESQRSRDERWSRRSESDVEREQDRQKTTENYREARPDPENPDPEKLWKEKKERLARLEEARKRAQEQSEQRERAGGASRGSVVGEAENQESSWSSERPDRNRPHLGGGERLASNEQGASDLSSRLKQAGGHVRDAADWARQRWGSPMTTN